MNKHFQFIVKILLTLIVITIAVEVNAQSIETLFDFNDYNWNVDNWDHWTQEQRESYLAGVRDAAEAIAFQMARGVGPKELLHSIVELFMVSRSKIYVYIQNRFEPTGTGRITRWISQEIINVIKNKNYKHASSYLR